MTEEWYWEYELEFFDELDEVMKISKGIVLADTMASAVEKIEHYYGKCLQSLKYLQAVTEGPLYEIREEENCRYALLPIDMLTPEQLEYIKNM